MLVDGGKKFLVVASADMVVDAFQQVISTDALRVDDPFLNRSATANRN